MSDPVTHYNNLRNIWFEAYSTMRAYMIGMDGDSARAVGKIVQDIVDAGPKHHDWPDTGAALFIRRDPELWHELANSRRK